MQHSPDRSRTDQVLLPSPTSQLHHPTPQSQLSSAFKRSDSFRSDQTDASSEARRVSFNSDVQIKKIPKRKSSLQQQPPLPPSSSNNNSETTVNVRKEDPPTDAESIAREAERILKHLQGVKCRASPTPQQQQQQQQQQQRPLASSSSSVTPTRSASANSHSHLQSSNSVKTCNNNNNNISNNNSSEECDSGLQFEGGASSSMQTATGGESLSSSSFGANEGASSSSDATAKNNNHNRLFGLHALNNLDIAVNGKNVNSMPGYQEVRQQYLDSSGNSADYSPQPVKRNQVISNGTFVSSPPNKPPRSKAPSASPPSIRRMAATTTTPHYAQPERSTKMVSSMMEQLSQDSRFRRRLAETTDDDGMSGVTSSAYSTHNNNRPSNYLPPGAVDNRELSPSSRLSPSRTCMTDTELLRSPTEVLYAVSDKYRHPSEHHLTHSASQTAHSELQPAYHTYDRRAVRQASSREDLLSDAPSSVRNRPSHHANGISSRSLDRYGHHSRGENKENAFKARIQVVSPDRAASPGGGGGGIHRKPYKTTINTANDDIIQYHGHRNSSHNHHHSADPYMSNSRRQQLYQKNQTYRRPESEHYKVPKNKAPVEYLRNGAVRHPGLIMNSAVAATDSDHSSSVYHRGPYSNSARGARGSRHPGEMDREGRTIRRDRVRAYSGCSTSPDREGSPEAAARGYSRPRPPPRSYSNLQQGHLYGGRRSPSTSPTRPPLARSSPGRELIANVVRRVTSGSSSRGNGNAVERQHSNRVANGRSPFRVHNSNSNLRRETSGDRLRAHSNNARAPTTAVADDDSEERLARFTEYRGGNQQEPPMTTATTSNGVHRRGSSVAYRNNADDEYLARERGRSLPPGQQQGNSNSNISDFYKSSQFKSMYALPPSPSRPAPVLDRAPSSNSNMNNGSSTLRRDAASRRALRSSRGVSISEGENTDGKEPPRRPQPPARRPSTKRQAPSPPGYKNMRRVVSSDREDRRTTAYPRVNLAERRVVSSDRERGGMQHPPQRRVRPEHRRASMGDALDSSYSESEGFVADPDQRPWSSVSEEDDLMMEDCYDDDELDELEEVGELISVSERMAPPSVSAASTATTTATIVRLQQQRPHSTAILYDKTPIVATYTYKEKPLGEFGRRWASSAHPSDIDSDYRRDLATSGHQEARGRDGGGTFRRSSPSVGRSSSSAREEERRKVLEIEMARRGGGGQQVGRSTSRASRTTAGTGRQQVVVRTRPMSQDDRDSQYSGQSSSSAKHRFEHPQNGARLARIKRSTSNATSAGVNGGGPRVVQHRKKLPASLTSSLNSSESEPVANGNNGNRSVFLHSACVADIPPNSVEKHQKPQPRAQSAESRDNNNTLARQQQQQSNLQKSKKISRSISLLAPWKRQPRSQSSGAQFSEIHYDNNNIYGQGGGMNSSGKPPRPPPPSQRGRIIIPAGDKKSASSTNLLKTDSEQMIVGSNERSRTLQRSSNNGSSKVSRSVSMPKDTRLAGWFRKKKR